MASPAVTYLADYTELLNGDIFTFLIGPQKESFKIHAELFKSLSSPLRTMISNGCMQESINRVATIEDVDPQTFTLFSQYAYTGIYRVSCINRNNKKRTWDSLTGSNESMPHTTSTPIPGTPRASPSFGSVGIPPTPPQTGSTAQASALVDGTPQGPPAFSGTIQGFPPVGGPTQVLQPFSGTPQGRGGGGVRGGMGGGRGSSTGYSFSSPAGLGSTNAPSTPLPNLYTPQPLINASQPITSTPQPNAGVPQVTASSIDHLQYPAEGMTHQEFRNYLIRLRPAEPCSDNLASHARLYVFANKYMVESLTAVCLHQLHRNLSKFCLNTVNIIRMTELLTFTFENTSSGTGNEKGVGSDLKNLVMTYVAGDIENLVKHEIFREMLVKNGELCTEVLCLTAKRLEK